MSRGEGPVSWFIWVLVGARLLGISGVSWDVAWHRAMGRESFWIPPHLVVYSAVAVGALVAVAVFVLEGWRLPRGYGTMVIGWVVIFLSAPFDEWWHRRHGLDVDVWSPPHLTAVAGSFVSGLGLVTALMAEIKLRIPGRMPLDPHLLSLRDARPPERLLLICFGLALWSPMFALGRFTIVAWTRDALFYPTLSSLLIPVVLVAAIQATSLRWAATTTASLYLAFMLLMAWTLGSAGLRPTSLPPFLLIPALVLDGLALASARGRWLFGPLCGTIFGLAFFGTEYAWTWLIVGRAWSAEQILGGVGGSIVAGALSGFLGDRLGRFLVSATRSR